MTHALVSGAAGFVGRHLVSHLERLGDDVTPWDRTDGGPDLRDAGAVTALFDRVRPDVCYHLAGDADVGGSWNHPLETFEHNAIGTLNVLEAARRVGVTRVLCVGSADVYGPVPESDQPIDETTPFRPQSPYAASKAAADALAYQAFLGHGADVLRARPFNHLGPGQRPSFVAAALAHRVARNELTGETEVIVGNLTPRRDFTDVRDVVRAYRLLVDHGDAGAAYNVCTGHDVAIGDLADGLLELATIPMQLVVDHDLKRPVDVPVRRGDNQRLIDATGWQPEIGLRQTLSDLLDAMRGSVRDELTHESRSA